MHAYFTDHLLRKMELEDFLAFGAILEATEADLDPGDYQELAAQVEELSRTLKDAKARKQGEG